MFYLVKNGDLCYYKIDSFENTGLVSHAFTTKHGGVSTGVFSTMNLRLSSDDSIENVMMNYKIITDELEIPLNDMVLSKQIHKTDIIKITEEHKGNGIAFENKFKSADALVTNVKGIPLCTFFADCVSIYLLDTKKQVLALAHSGWRGTVNNITGKTVQFMIDEYGSDPIDIISAIGPSIRQKNFEVGFEVSDEFVSAGYDIFVDFSKEKPHVDLQGIIAKQLLNTGIPVKNITDSGICTVDNKDMFYSHRVMGDERGAMAAIAMLK